MPRWRAVMSLTIACAGCAAVAQAAEQNSSHAAVSPKSGHRSTRFVVSFDAPQSAGQHGSSSIRYVVSASSRSNSRHCVSSISDDVTQAAAGSTVHVTLNPKHVGGRWCRGVFDGQVEEVIASSCGCPGPVSADIVCPEHLCPAIQPAPQKIGTFSFRVRKIARTHH